MKKFSSTQSIGEIVAVMPKAGEIFKLFKIDFCCGGHRLLTEAITEQGLDEAQLLEQLQNAYEETKKLGDRTDFRSMSASQLIDYILDKHHTFVKGILPQISGLTTTILRVHGGSHSELFKVHKLFHSLKTELEQHLIKEEELLFPLMKDYDSQESGMLLDKLKSVMKETEDEHEGAGKILKELRSLTKDYAIPEGACATYVKAYEKLQELESDLFAHIHLENNILFKI